MNKVDYSIKAAQELQNAERARFNDERESNLQFAMVYALLSIAQEISKLPLRRN